MRTGTAPGVLAAMLVLMGLFTRGRDRSMEENGAKSEPAGSLFQTDGRQHRGPLPLQPLHAECLLTYPRPKNAGDPQLYAARAMEDKWAIYLWDGYLYFARSWTGELEFRAKVDLSDRGMTIRSVDAKSQSVDGDGSLAVRCVRVPRRPALQLIAVGSV